MSKRRGVGRAIPPVMYIYCEGEKTEPLYLDAYIENREKRGFSVFKIPKTRKNSPEQLVDEAIKKKKSSSTTNDDVFWVVYDQEHLTKQSITAHRNAWNKASKNGINVAISCVCFELWLLLHFGYTTKQFTSYSDLMSQSPLKKLIPNYEKGNSKTYFLLRARVSDAKRNAEKLARYAHNNHSSTNAPYLFTTYTSFHELLDAIDAFGINR